MQDKEHLTRSKLLKIDGKDVASFLDVLERKEPAEISAGMWNKLYALIAIVRRFEHVNYWIYDGYTNSYDVTNRQVEKRIIENSNTIGDIVRNKK